MVKTMCKVCGLYPVAHLAVIAFLANSGDDSAPRSAADDHPFDAANVATCRVGEARRGECDS